MRVVAGALICAAAATRAPAQSRFVIRAPEQRWLTVETAHWTIHYPARASEFAACLIARLEPIYRATSALVGYATGPRVTLVIEDAMGFDGAYASANARAPVIVLQTQPSLPRTGGYSDCATARMVHELTHILQLSRPWTSENPWWQRAFVRLLPAEPGLAVLRRTPWLRESYAEHIEGRLAPTGAPYTPARANSVRLLSLRDGLPAYETLNDSYEGQYLIGAAFVDWLAQRSGEDAFRQLWPLMASPRWPGEPAAARQFFGAPLDSLYGVFVGIAKARSRDVLARVTAAGIVRGEGVRGLGFADGITVSPDGARVAAVTGRPLVQLHIWSSRDTSAAPERLPVPTGQSPTAPRFSRDGKTMLIVNWELVGRGVWRPDLFEWTLATRTFRRITHRVGIRDADPLPDGRTAVGSRCEFGICDVVMIDLSTGQTRTILHGAPNRAYFRPRASSDGTTIAVAEQSGSACRIVLLDVASGVRRYADPDDGVWRYEPAFLADGRLVVVSEASGIQNLEIIDSEQSVTTLTRLAAPTFAPEPDPVSPAVYFIRETPGGSELWHIRLDEAAKTTITVRDSSFAPAVPVPLPRPSPPLFAPESIPAARPYGMGPRFTSVLPTMSVGPDGVSGGALLWSSDIVGRLSAMVNGSLGAWRGAGANVAVRFLPLPVFINAASVSGPDMIYRGVSVRTETESGTWAHRQRTTLGAAYAGAESGVRRALATGTYAVDRSQVGERAFTESFGIAMTGGRTSGLNWARGLASASIETARLNATSTAMLSGSFGIVSGNAPAVEWWAVGGSRPPLLSNDLALAQRIAQPLLESTRERGTRVATLQVTAPRVGPVAPFVWWGMLRPSSDNGHTVIGVGRTFDDDPRRNWRVPGVRLSGAAGYAFGTVRGFRASMTLTMRQ